jgi:hypothetical protein
MALQEKLFESGAARMFTRYENGERKTAGDNALSPISV